MVFAANDQRRVRLLRSPVGAAPAMKGGSCQECTATAPSTPIPGPTVVSHDDLLRISQHLPCTCRECHPGSSGGMFVFVKDAAEAVTSVDGQVGEPIRVGDRFG